MNRLEKIIHNNGKMLRLGLLIILFFSLLFLLCYHGNCSQNREKLGQLLMLDFRNWGIDKEGKEIPFTVSNSQIENIIKKYNVGGVILFRENIVDPAQTITLVRSLQAASKIPLLIGTDQEGGMVARIQTGTDMPGNMVLGATRDYKLAEKVAKAIGEELYCQGINLDLAPDVDVNVNPKNPVIGVRSFSDNPKLVSDFGTAYMNGLKNASVLSCIKHFPGYGDTATDPHLGLAIVNHNLKQLEEIDLFPFNRAIEAGAETVMIAHAIVPALDNTKVKSIKDGAMIGTPATLSYPIITNLLRNKMKFKGLILVDAMDMKAISDNFGEDDATIKAILAGCDVVLMPVRIWNEKEIPKLEKLILAMENEYNRSTTFKKRVDESYRRIIEFKKKHRLETNTFATGNIQEHIERAKSIVGSKAHKDLETKASEAGITLLKKNNKTVPFKMCDGSKILLVDSNSLRLAIAKEEIERVASYNGVKVNISTSKAPYNSKPTSELKDKIKNSDLCIILTYNLTSSDNLPEAVAKMAKESSVKCVSVSCRNPYDAAYIPDAGAILSIYGAVGFDQTNSRLAISTINLINGIKTIFLNNKNNKPFNNPIGKLPVEIPSKDGKNILYKYGTGLSY